MSEEKYALSGTDTCSGLRGGMTASVTLIISSTLAIDPLVRCPPSRALLTRLVLSSSTVLLFADAGRMVFLNASKESRVMGDSDLRPGCRVFVIT